jgi:hypothetical protein
MKIPVVLTHCDICGAVIASTEHSQEEFEKYVAIHTEWHIQLRRSLPLFNAGGLFGGL